MPLVCPQCHTENSEQLRVCIACGAALPLPAKPSPPPSDHGQDSDTFDALYAPTLMMGAAQGSGVDPEGQMQAAPGGLAHTHLPPLRRRPRRRLPGLVAAAAVLAVAAWYWHSKDSAPDPGPAAQPAATVPPRPAPASALVVAASAPASVAPADFPLAPTLPAEASAASTAPGAAASSPPSPTKAEPSSTVQGAGGRSASTAPLGGTASRMATGADRSSAPRPAPRTATTGGVNAGVAASNERTPEAIVSTAAMPVVEVPSVVSTAPKPRPTAQQVCADRHFLLRPFCESLECGKQEHAEEPYCKALKEQAARRPEQ